MKTLFLTGITCLALAGCSSVSIHDSTVTMGDDTSLIHRDILGGASGLTLSPASHDTPAKD